MHVRALSGFVCLAVFGLIYACGDDVAEPNPATGGRGGSGGPNCP